MNTNVAAVYLRKKTNLRGRVIPKDVSESNEKTVAHNDDLQPIQNSQITRENKQILDRNIKKCVLSMVMIMCALLTAFFCIFNLVPYALYWYANLGMTVSVIAYFFKNIIAITLESNKESSKFFLRNFDFGDFLARKIFIAACYIVLCSAITCLPRFYISDASKDVK